MPGPKGRQTGQQGRSRMPVGRDSHDPTVSGSRSVLVDQHEMARLLGVTAGTVTRLKQEGRIPYVRLSERVHRFHPDEVLDAVNAMRVNATTR